MPNKPKTPNRNVRLADEIWLPLVSIASERGVPVSDVVREALSLYLTQPPTLSAQ